MATDEQADEVFGVAQLLAQHGISQSRESALRSAVSRGYYSVFLAAQRRTGISDRNDVHSKVIYACSRQIGYMQASRIRIMKELRVAADYFRDAESARDADPTHDLTDWDANWTYVAEWAPRLRERLKQWKT